MLASLSNSAPPEFRYSTAESDKRSARDPLALPGSLLTRYFRGAMINNEKVFQILVSLLAIPSFRSPRLG